MSDRIVFRPDGPPKVARDANTAEVNQALSPNGAKKRRLTKQEWGELRKQISNTKGEPAVPPSSIKKALRQRGLQ